MSYATLMTLAELHFECGLIGIVEFSERCDIAAWVFGLPGFIDDPRDSETADRDAVSNGEDNEPRPVCRLERNGDQSDASLPEYLHFMFRGWVFTKADPDFYPSTPHGHWLDQNRSWPKMDPYNGRVFKRKNVEATGERLSKDDLKLLWSDEKFKDFCRSHIVWYMEEFPHHRFRVGREKLFRWPRI